MATLPQLIEEDIEAMNRALDELLARSEACAALIIDKGGFLITQTVHARQFDLVTLAALSAASFAATQGIANLVSETNFTSIYQQGEIHSLLVINIDEHCLLTVVFPAQVSVGAVKYFAAATVKQVANQLQKATQRNPTARLDLSLINMAETGPLFRKKTA
jgi:predicted regulator of Ras-like GTPase activity (Roadblock/LC7/MglB family)